MRGARGPWRGPATAAGVAVLVAWALLPGVAAGAGGEDGFAGASGEAGPTGSAPAAAQPVGALPGIDVSHHQDVIDWPAVAASGQRFVFAKATEGRTFVDPMYAVNRAGAEANGLAFGAYHFAQPDGSEGDAVAEADHFVDTAQPSAGNLLPVLDIERTNGLSQAQITEWILTWLGRVTERLGVRPIVYTSPAGWESRTGDTTAVAEAGYTVLWIAHWGVAEPRLPANEWNGNGWTFWQYGNCGSVPGIAGCVDVDWYRGGSFDPVTIPSPDVVPPTVTLIPPVGVADPLTVSFSEVVHQVLPTNTFVRSTTTGLPVDASSTCRSKKQVVVDCATGNVRTVLVEPVRPLVLGETYEAVVNPVGVPFPVLDRGGNAAPPTAQGFAAPTAVEEDAGAGTFAWRSVGNRRAFGRSYAAERAPGASATFSFSGRSITWYTVAGPDQGRAAVWIDGVRRGTFDQYASKRAFEVPRAFQGLQRGRHTIAIRVLGQSSSAASDALVAVDAFRLGDDLVRNPALETTWGRARLARASGGSVAVSDVARASVEVSFRGTGVEWITVRDRRQGRAAIYVDGVLQRTVDNYAATPTFGVARSVTGLAEGVHTLRIVVLGESRGKAKGAWVSVDGFAVVP